MSGREQRAVRRAAQQFAVGSKEIVVSEIQRMTLVRTDIGEGAHLFAPAHQQPAKRPVAGSDEKFARPRVGQLVEMQRRMLRPRLRRVLCHRRAVSTPAVPIEASTRPARIISQNSTMPGTAAIVVNP